MGIKINPFTGQFDLTGSSGGGGGGAVDSVNGQTGDVVLTTDDVNEGSTNKYFTDGRAQTAAVEDAINNGVTNKAPSENAVFDALALKANLSSFGLLNPQELYVDAIGGSDVTGVGSVVFPLQTLEQAVSLATDTSKKYVIFLSPGQYATGAPITIPSNISLFGKGASINNLITIDFIPGIESNIVYDGLGASIIMDMSTSNQSIATFRDGGYDITRTDSTPGPYFFTVNNSNVTNVNLTGNGLFNNCVFIGTSIVQNTGQLLLNGSVIGININVIGTGSISMTGCTFVGSITGTIDSGNTPNVFADASSLGYGGTITTANVTDLDSAPYISFNPANSGDWLTPPTQVKGALDELASRITAPVVGRYNAIFNATTDWGSPSAGLYTFTVPETTHLKGTTPNVLVFENVSGSYEKTEPNQTIVDPSGNVSITVLQSPDTRFAGKILIL